MDLVGGECMLKMSHCPSFLLYVELNTACERMWQVSQAFNSPLHAGNRVQVGCESSTEHFGNDSRRSYKPSTEHAGNWFV